MAGQHEYSREEVTSLLEPCLGRTLGDVDAADVFFRVDPARNPDCKPKVKGIIGDVVEQSIFGYPPDSEQRPDLLVDGTDVELKSTALRESRKDGGWEAKEPMSITAVSIDTIASEKFEDSSFWHKVRRMLIVYYHYESERVALSIEYSRFHLLDYQFHEFDPDEVETLRNDWRIVHDFIEQAQATLAGPALRDRYAMLGSALRPKLMLIDTSPRYPNSPRFRLKRATVTVIARKKLGDSRYAALPAPYTAMDDIDARLRRQSARFRGMTVEEMGHALGVSTGAKNVAEMLFVRMFGGTGKINGIELFAKAGIQVKTAVLLKGKPAEDTKFYRIDFAEFRDPALAFEDSEMFRYFTESHFVFMVMEEESRRAPASERRFLGFKRLSVPDEVVYGEVRSCFESTLDLVANGRLRFVPETDRKTGLPRMNRSGTVRGAPNFPKSKDCQVFVKGTGSDARSRTEVVPGVPMYGQQVWWGKRLTARLLSQTPWV